MYERTADKEVLPHGMRQVSPARKRKLRKRGECVVWHRDTHWWVWAPKFTLDEVRHVTGNVNNGETK